MGDVCTYSKCTELTFSKCIYLYIYTHIATKATTENMSTVQNSVLKERTNLLTSYLALLLNFNSNIIWILFVSI